MSSMSLNFYRDTIQVLCESKGWNRLSVPTVWLLLTEEIGELASAIRQNFKIYPKSGLRKPKGVDIKLEMGDVFSYLFQLAYMLDIDLDDMWIRHQQKVLQRNYNMQQ